MITIENTNEEQLQVIDSIKYSLKTSLEVAKEDLAELLCHKAQVNMMHVESGPVICVRVYGKNENLISAFAFTLDEFLKETFEAYSGVPEKDYFSDVKQITDGLNEVEYSNDE